MIVIEVFTHTHIDDKSILFEEGDIHICHIDDGDYIKKDDFEKIYSHLNNYSPEDLSELKDNTWIKVCLERCFQEDEEGFNRDYFETISIEKS
jgi:hypothetical protein